MENINNERFYYAQLNTNNICTSVTEYPCKMEDANLIELEDNNIEYLGCKYDNGSWIAIEKVENIDEIRKEKLQELSSICQQTIFNGVDVALSNGEIKHFSLKIEDQMNLNGLVSQVSLGNINSEEGVPYHADGEICIMYSIEDFTLIANTASAFKVQQTTYCNHLMAYVKSLDDIETIKNVVYGQDLTDEFLENYMNIMRSLSNESE